MTTLFVTGSGTGVGKTVVCCRLLEELPLSLSVRALKPVVTGFDPQNPSASDTARLLAARGHVLDDETIGATSPWRFRAPLSADMAAAREGAAIPFADLVAFCRETSDQRLTLIEGIGGVMAPLDDRHTVLDWIDALDAGVILTVGSYLGSLSHALTALNALKDRRADIAAIVVSPSSREPVPTSETVATLRRFVRQIDDAPIQLLPRPLRSAAPLLLPCLEDRLFDD